MDNLSTSLLRGLREEFTESNAKLKEACNDFLRDLENKVPQLMYSQVKELNDVKIELFFGAISAESKSWKVYHNELQNRLKRQFSSTLEKHLNRPLGQNELIEKIKIDREGENNQLNGIAYVQEKEITKLKRYCDDSRIKTITEVRDIFIQTIDAQSAQLAQPDLPQVRITLVFPTSSTLNILMYHAEADEVKVDCIYHLPSITLDSNEVINMKRGIILDPWKLREKCPMDLAVTQRIRDDLPFNPSDERFLADGFIRKIPSIMRYCVDSKSKRFLINPEFDKPGSAEFLKLAKSVIDRFKNKHKLPGYLDFDHIHAHYLAGRDIFVTEDKAILKTRSQLKDLGIRIMNFEELLSSIETNGIQLLIENPEEPKPQRIKIQIAEREEGTS